MKVKTPPAIKKKTTPKKKTQQRSMPPKKISMINQKYNSLTSSIYNLFEENISAPIGPPLQMTIHPTVPWHADLIVGALNERHACFAEYCCFECCWWCCWLTFC